MSYEPETSRDAIDLSEKGETSFDPGDPIEVTKAEGEVNNPGSNSPPPAAQHDEGGEGGEDAGPPTG